MKNSNNVRKKRRFAPGHWQFTLMALPGVLLIFLFSYLPMFGLPLAFKDYKFNLGIYGSPWNGLDNFRYLFESNTFWTILRNTILYNLLFIVLQIVLGVFLALCMERIKSKKALKCFQSGMFIPYFLSWIVISYVSHSLFDYEAGMINHFLQSMGLDGISFYSETKYWPWILTFFHVFKNIGFQVLMYYGTLLGIDREIYEAAVVDGCSEFKKIIYITLPNIKPTIIVLTLLAIGGIFSSDFGMFYYIPKDTGGLYPVTDVLPVCRTGVVTILLLILLNFWNEWLRNMLYISNDRIVTLQYYLSKILASIETLKKNANNASFLVDSGNVPVETVRMAICIIAAGPMVFVFMFFQKYFVGGISVGSVKG